MERVKLKIEGICSNISECKKFDILSQYGQIVTITSGINEVTVQYSTPKQANAAYNALNNKIIGRNTIRVSFLVPPKPKSLLCTYIFTDTIPKIEKYLEKYDGNCTLIPIRVSGQLTNFIVISFKTNNRQVKMQIIRDFNDHVIFENNVYFTEIEHVDETEKDKFDTQQEIIKEILKIESRMVFINNLIDYPNKDHLHKILSQFGEVDYIDYSVRYNNKVILIYMHTEEGAAQAIKNLDHTYLLGGPLPIYAVPFIHKFIPHSLLGLICINELEPYFSIKSLVEEFSKFGNVFTAAAAPRGACKPIGFILMRSYEEAKEAVEKTTRENVFLFPPVQAVEGSRLFSSDNRCPSLTAVVCGLPAIQDSKLREKFNGVASLHSFLIQKTSKVAFVTFSNIDYLIEFLSLYRKEKKHAEVIGNLITERASDLLKTVVFDPSLSARLYITHDITQSIENHKLMQKFEEVGHVSAAMQLNEITYILFSEPGDYGDNEKLLKLFNRPIRLTPFSNHSQHSLTARSSSVGELSATFLPSGRILQFVRNKYPEKAEVVASAIRLLPNQRLYQLALDPGLLENYIREL